MTKCCECGYLAVRIKKDHSLGEASSDFRERGAVPNVPDEKGMNLHALHEPMPLCLARQSYLRDAIKGIDKQKSQNDEVKRIINQEIDCETCKEFTDWQQGFTPKEHRDILDRENMLKWQAEREEKDQLFRQRESESNRRYRIIELVLVILTIIAVFIAAFIERGGQPTINIITPMPSGVTIEQQPSVPDKGGSQP